MSITYRGAVCTGGITVPSGEIALVIECSLRANVRVDILRLIAEMDTVAAVTGASRIVPLFKVQKFAGTASGGVVMTGKAAFDSAQSSDAGVIIRQALGYAGDGAPAITVTGTPLTMMTGFGERVTTIYGQQNTEGLELVRRINPDTSKLYLNPGEVMAVQWVNDTYPVGGTAIFNLLWEEDSLGTEYTISGNVTLSGSAVSGAKVLVVTDIDRDMPAPQVEVITTGAPGTWSKTLAAGVKADAFVQYRNGETLYTDDGKPYLAKP